MIETSSVHPRKSSEIFGNLRKISENVRKRSPYLRNNFGESSEIFGKWSEIFGKSSKTSSLVCLCNKQNITCSLCGYEFYLLVFNSTSHSFAALTREISSWTLEDKIHIHARSCNILYLSNDLIMWIGHRKEIRKLTFRALALRRSDSLRRRANARNISFRISFTVANSHYQLIR